MEILRKYILANKWMSGFAIYALVAVVLKIGFSIDVLIPCLWKTFFHFECPGCGLTTSFIKLLTLDFYGAYRSNPLIFIILLFGIGYVLRDFLKFKTSIKYRTAAVSS